MTGTPATSAWTTRERLFLTFVFLGAIAIRIVLLPARELTGDMDEFARWIHGIAVNGWARTYDQPVTFPAAMAWLWGSLAALQPAFGHVLDASDPAIRALMKAPASLADIGIAAAIVWWHRDRPARAILVAAALLFLPVTWYVSAWWGQFESLYVLPAVLAVVALRARMPWLAAGLIAVSLMTKPQALPFLVPFAAWYLGVGGVRFALRGAAIGLGVAILLWLPFVAAGGPANYLATLRTLQDGIYGVLSLRAWNPWWLIQGSLAGKDFLLDANPIIGPVTFRQLALLITALLEAMVFVAVHRRPTVGRLALGLGVASLAAFIGLTTMHERYAYPAVIFLAMTVADRRLGAAWLLLAVAVSANLIAAAPPSPEIGRLLPAGGALSVVGTVAIVAAFVIAFARLVGPLGPSADGSPGRRRLSSQPTSP